MIEELKRELNDQQLEAVKILEGPLLIIAGAGSGKTRTITFRMAQMLQMGIPQKNILALTFTNKAAKEMAQRVKTISSRGLSNLTVSTFHSFGVKVLKESIQCLGYRENFSIYDQGDQLSLLKEVAREQKVPAEDFDPYSMAQLFSGIKTQRIRWEGDNLPWKSIYASYQEHLLAYNAVDFDDLITLPIRLFEEHPDVLKKYQRRFKYIMVDEFQDTSLAQYRFMKLLALGHRNICAVGDDDQSIYSWRGANYRNFTNFEADFPEFRETKLEQNYRSTQNILSAANFLIAHNTNRKEKALWTGTATGKSIEIFYPEDETREARFIAERIRSFVLRENVKYHDIGVLVRTNGLTASIEEAFLEANIPYKVSGGMSFFQRKEIKDILSYLRVIANPDDDLNLLRIINTPRRGVGLGTLKTIRAIADEKGWSFYSTISALRWAEDSPLPKKIKAGLEDFLAIIETYRERFFGEKRMADVLRSLVDALGLWEHLLQEHQANEKIAQWKFQNILRFTDMFEKWCSNPDNLNPTLYDYLTKISLVNSDEDEDEEGKVNLMTIHASKGLEFEITFLAGVEARILPHARAIEENPDNIEEERRIFYVAITRARRKIFITACRTRRIMREVVETGPSPFMEEIPSDLVEFHEEEALFDQEAASDAFARLKAKLG